MKREWWCWIVLLLLLWLTVGFSTATAADYKNCVEECKSTGCVKDKCFQHCEFSSDGDSTDSESVDGPWYMHIPLYLQWKQWDCLSDCRYHCMLNSEEEREVLGTGPVKYNGKWPFKRVFGLQEPGSVAFSALNLATHIHGWLSFFFLIHYKLPLKPQSGKPYYEYTGLWHTYGLLAINSCLWSAVHHSLDVDLTEKLDISSGVALLGYSLILAIVRTFSVKDEAGRVMVAAPFISFVTTHILYLNFYQLDHGLNMKVCMAMGIAQLLVWAVWAGITRDPSKWKLWTVAVGSSLAMVLKTYDFPPYECYVDSHALWHASAIPLSFLWWSFIKADATVRTTSLMKKVK